MNKLHKLIEWFPGFTIIGFGIYAYLVDFDLESIKMVSVIVCLILSLNLLLRRLVNVKDYCMLGVAITAIVCILLMLVSDRFGEFYKDNIIVGLYLGLFLATALPPLFGAQPFTMLFPSSYPEQITKGNQYHETMLKINCFWALAFFTGGLLSFFLFPEITLIRFILKSIIPVFSMLLIGVSATVTLQKRMKKKLINL